MKKYSVFVVLILIILLLTGCKNTSITTNSQNETTTKEADNKSTIVEEDARYPLYQMINGSRIYEFNDIMDMIDDETILLGIYNNFLVWRYKVNNERNELYYIGDIFDYTYDNDFLSVSLEKDGTMVVHLNNGATRDIGKPAKYDEETGFVYRLLDDGTYSVSLMSSYQNLMQSSRTIPATYKGITVSEIGKYAFKNLSSLSVVISDSIKTIKNYAFYKIEYIRALRIPGTVKTIEKNFLFDCNRIGQFEFLTNSLSALLNSSNISQIDKLSFLGTHDELNTAIKGISIPKSSYNKVIYCSDKNYKVYDIDKKYNIILPDASVYFDESNDIYSDVFGEFKTAFDLAKEEKTDLGKRYALMAVSEAKLLESGTIVPISSNNRQFKISRVVPYSTPSVLYGIDQYKVNKALVVNENPITVEERDTIKSIYKEKHGTGTYESSIKEWLSTNHFTLNTTYNTTYTSEPYSWDILGTRWLSDIKALANVVENLYEYDMEGLLKPALAESMPVVSDDGLTVTITLKSGIKWVNQSGKVVASLKADDFVAGMQHLLDVSCGIEDYYVFDVLLNAREYGEGSSMDFSKVGVKALSDTVIEYTLCKPSPYFITLLTSGAYAPLPRSYYISKGGKFGADFNQNSENYLYGKGPANILYCGPYIVTESTTETKIVFDVNNNYWDKDNLNIKKIVWTFDNGMNDSTIYQDMKDGKIAEITLSDTLLEQAQNDNVQGTDNNIFNLYAFVGDINGYSYLGYININRYEFGETGNAYTIKSTKSDSEKELAKAALSLQDFRLALLHAFNREEYLKQFYDSDTIALATLINSYTPGTFVTLPNEVALTIGDETVTYPTGTYYGKIMQDVLDKDGYSIKVWKEETTIESSTGFDGWYNLEKAKEYFSKALLELENEGFDVSEKLIIIDFPFFSGSNEYLTQAQAFKNSIEEAFEGKVHINLVSCGISSNLYSLGYFKENGYESCYDIFAQSAISPDYGDPEAYLKNFSSNYRYSILHLIGLF